MYDVHTISCTISLFLRRTTHYCVFEDLNIQRVTIVVTAVKKHFQETVRLGTVHNFLKILKKCSTLLTAHAKKPSQKDCRYGTLFKSFFLLNKNISHNILHAGSWTQSSFDRRHRDIVKICYNGMVTWFDVSVIYCSTRVFKTLL